VALLHELADGRQTEHAQPGIDRGILREVGGVVALDLVARRFGTDPNHEVELLEVLVLPGAIARGQVDAKRAVLEEAVGGRDEVETVRPQKVGHARHDVLVEPVEAEGLVNVEVELGGESRDRAMLGEAGSAALLEQDHRVPGTRVRAVRQCPDPFTRVPERPETAGQERLGRGTAGAKNGVRKSVDRIHAVPVSGSAFVCRFGFRVPAGRRTEREPAKRLRPLISRRSPAAG